MKSTSVTHPLHIAEQNRTLIISLPATDQSLCITLTPPTPETLSDAEQIREVVEEAIQNVVRSVQFYESVSEQIKEAEISAYQILKELSKQGSKYIAELAAEKSTSNVGGKATTIISNKSQIKNIRNVYVRLLNLDREASESSALFKKNNIICEEFLNQIQVNADQFAPLLAVHKKSLSITTENFLQKNKDIFQPKILAMQEEIQVAIDNCSYLMKIT